MESTSFKELWSIVDIIKCYHLSQFTGRKLAGGKMRSIGGKISILENKEFMIFQPQFKTPGFVGLY